MFEVTSTDVAALNDADLRTLVARLALAELNRNGLPLAGVTAGGNQDAADGGIDVRVEVAAASTAPDFVPRQMTGFQVKKPDMSAAAIKAEMRPKGVLRPAIGELADARGAYIIVSFQSSVADRPLADRRKAMRAAVTDHPKAEDLHVDFYDRDRIATWVNEYPGVAAWVRVRVGRELSGWRPIGDWSDEAVFEGRPYLCDSTACLVDERSRDRESLPLLDGIARLRAALGKPRQAVRLIGLSGLGKTRLVQALFETDVGEMPLDAGLAVYTDYSEGTTPTARDMAHRLIASNRRTILVVDNCNPETHAQLARICTGNQGNVSLITVEYDVRDDEPERTEVFRLQNASPALVEEWLKREFDHISQIDRSRIATFSDGNFRVARALADTLRKGETLGQLKSHELFQKIFQQRNEHDQSLQLAAEDLSLLYSFDGEDCGADGELARIGRLRGVAARDIFAAAVDLRRRAVVQARGRWRAVLPQAIANRLAAHALQRIPDAEFDAFCASLPARMLKSLSRRLGYLHDSPESQRVVQRWLDPDGSLGDLLLQGDLGLEVVRNLAPVAPEAVLAKIEIELAGPRGPAIVAASNQERRHWIGLLKTLAYEPAMFEGATMSLARFVAAEPENYNHNSALTPFSELFHLYISGTLAFPQQRRDLVRRLSRETEPSLRRCASLALNELLELHHFSSMSHHDFGARPRDFGWVPSTSGEIFEWFKHGISLTVEVNGAIDGRFLLARKIPQLWRNLACEDDLERASEAFSRDGPWIDGWLAFRAALHFSRDPLSVERRNHLLTIIDRLKPSNLLDEARAFVLTPDVGGPQIFDGEEDVVKAWAKAADRATKLGEAFAVDETILRAFLRDIFSERSDVRAWEFGRGLARGAEDVAHVWATLQDVLTTMCDVAHNVTVLGGFLSEAAERDFGFVANVLDAISDDPVLVNRLPWLQSQVAMDGPGIERIVNAIDAGKLVVTDLVKLATGVVRYAPAAPFKALLVRIAAMPDGSMLALEILHMHLHCLQDENREVGSELIACGRALLASANCSERRQMSDFALKRVVQACLSGPSGEADARTLCNTIRAALDGYRLSAYDINYLLEGLFETQPFVALDELVLAGGAHSRDRVFKAKFNRSTPIEKVEPMTLRAWANCAPAARYTALGHALPLFSADAAGDETGISSRFLEVLEDAPDRAAFLGNAHNRLQPQGWSGPLHLVLERRRMMLRTLLSHHDPAVRAWVADLETWLPTWIAAEQKKESEREESFE